MKIKTFPMGTIGTNCYVISDNAGTTAIIDCDGDPKLLFQYVSDNKLNPTHILLTHGHSDHIGSVDLIKEQYHCQVLAAKEELPILTNPSANCSLYSGQALTVQPDILFETGDVIKVGDLEFSVLLTPGHTQGSTCFILEDNIFSGDTLFQGSCGRTDLPTGDWGTIVQSLKTLKDLPGDYSVHPGHGPSTTLSIERRSNPYMQ